MTKEEFLKNHWFNFPLPEGTAYTLEYTPKNDANVDAIRKTTLNNATDVSELDMRIALSRKLLTDKDYEYTQNDVKSIFDAHEDYNLKHPRIIKSK
ncbi:hypothetical protein [uncultured Aquimarina sp.]|uniref:hypothetical protein n=1 Tax=uncultured Aquimarina sp. TaxID=575652 RepID=UPI00261CFECF|nr:hypothetical protein [uncultured Aquimarina sp.]